MHVEVHEIPGNREPDQAQAGQRECHIVHFRQVPPVGRLPTPECVHTGEDGAKRAQHTQDSKTDDPGRKGIQNAMLFALRKKSQPASEETDEEDAHQAHTKPQFPLRGRRSSGRP